MKESALSRLELKSMYGALAVSVVILGIKWWVYVSTHSAVAFSDASETVVHLLAVSLSLYCLRQSYMPPDDDHHFGHDKVAYLSSAVEGALVMLAGFAILYNGVVKAFKPDQVHNINQGLLLVGVTCVINGILARYLFMMGTKTHSIVLVSHSHHLMSDVYTSVGVLLGLLLVKTTGIMWLDPAVAAAFSFYVIYTGSKVFRSSLLGLTDVTEPEWHKKAGESLKTFCAKAGIEFDRLRMRKSANQVYVDFHLHFPKDLYLSEAHRIGTEAERLVAKVLPMSADIMSHIEVEDDQDNEQGAFVKKR